MNEFKICNICMPDREIRLRPKLEALDSTAKIVVGCNGFCQIGQTKEVCIVNGIPVIADNEDELLEKIKEKINK